MSVDFELKEHYDINDLISIITVLRAPGGCPWDREQTHESIKKNLIEETYEVIEAINQNNTAGLREELGDVLMQVMLHSEMEREQGHFAFEDVVDELVQKLVVRHPHVFGEVVANNSSEALDSWNAIKQQTKQIKSQGEAMQKVPKELPALMRAQKIQQRAAKSGFDWEQVDGAVDKLYEEINELKKAMDCGDQPNMQEEFGDVLFSCVNIARFLHIDSEEALSDATEKFLARYLEVERMAQEQGIDMKEAGIEVLDELWDKAKKIKRD